jgi:recombination protein RecR
MYPRPVQILIDELGRLPGVGPKSAQRIAFHLLAVDDAEAERLVEAVRDVKENVRPCPRCFNVTDVTHPECESDGRSLCTRGRRDPALLCVVEEPRDVVAIERTHEFSGRYHVLGGALNPLEGMGVDQLHVRELLDRLEPEEVREVIVCTNPNIEGEATAMYLARLLSQRGVRVTRPASGLPVGGDLEYADEVTLGRALEGRREIDQAGGPGG